MKRTFLLCIIILAFASVYAIRPEEVLNVPDATNFAWLDYDKDGDEDVLVTGNNVTRLYRNDGVAGFVETDLQFAGFAEADIHIADFNHDLYPDIIICGYETEDCDPDYDPGNDPVPFSIVKVYTNNCSGGLVESDEFATYLRNTQAALLWSQNGYSRYLISGYDWNDNFVCRYYSYDVWGSATWQQWYLSLTLTNITYSKMTIFEGDIYLLTSNEASTTVTKYAGDYNLDPTVIIDQLIPSTSGYLKIQDIDNDNDPDILISGDINYLFRNSNGVYEDISVQFPGLSSQSDIGDIDGDGLMDVLVNCRTVYLQNNEGTYTMSQTNLFVFGNSFGWFDFDQDGDLDLIERYSSVGFLYRNNGNLSFESIFVYSYILSINFAKWRAIDYDHDGDCDIAAIGYYSSDFRIVKLSGDYSFTRYDLPFSNGTGASWADYDNDGDKDILIWGYGYHSKLYSNQGNYDFELAIDNFPLSTYYSQWVDFNNDGLLDISFVTKNSILIYFNMGNNTFSQTVSIPTYIVWWHCYVSYIDFGDFDNDGDLDLLVSNQTIPGDKRGTVIYRNDGNNSFTMIDCNVDGFDVGNAKFIDFDNDGLLDIFVAGNSRGTLDRDTQGLYRNIGNGEFSKVATGYSGINLTIAGSCDDYDSDGDFDILFSGTKNMYDLYSNSLSRRYRNNGIDGIMIDAPFGGNRALLNAKGADFNNNGSLDLLSSTYGGDKWVAHLDVNVNGVYHQSCSGISTIEAFDAPKWVDINNDHKLDIYVLEHRYYPEITKHSLFQNNIQTVNSCPSPPTITYNDQTGFSFSNSVDDTTPTVALTYDIRIGTTPGGSDVVCPMADLTTGYRKVVEFGRHAWGPMDLPGDQTYYAAAQAIDSAYEGSAFGPEISFYVPPKPQMKLISSRTLEFSEQYIAYDSEPQTIVITNTGTAPLIISEPTHTLADSPFRVSPNSFPMSVAVGDTLVLSVIFCPSSTSALCDTLSLLFNGKYYNNLRIGLAGSGIHVPPSVVENVQLNMLGDSAHLSWDPVESTIFDVPMAIDRYVVIFSEDPYEKEHSYYYLGSTTDTTFIHPRVARFRKHMYYKIKAVKFYDREQAEQFDNLTASRNDLRWQDVIGIIDQVRRRRF